MVLSEATERNVLADKYWQNIENQAVCVGVLKDGMITWESRGRRGSLGCGREWERASLPSSRQPRRQDTDHLVDEGEGFEKESSKKKMKQRRDKHNMAYLGHTIGQD